MPNHKACFGDLESYHKSGRVQRYGSERELINRN